MAYKINGTQVIDDDGNLVNFSAYNLNNDDGQIEIQSNSPMVGTVSGYTSGGADSNVIDKFPFATDTNATDVGDLTQTRSSSAGQSSTIHGYISGGYFSPPATFVNTIDKFPFATNRNATDVGNLSQIRMLVTGQSSFTHGYTSGGGGPPGPTIFNTIDKFLFANDANATDVGDLTQARQGLAGQSSTTNGYSSGGAKAPPTPVQTNTIDKFSFAVNNNASDVGDLTQSREGAPAGQSSTTHGYSSGGAKAPPTPVQTNTIDKFPFSSDTNATDVGDLTQVINAGAGQSSVSSGYSSGGVVPPSSNVIDKFPFATDTNATDVGDLTAARSDAAGQQD